MARNTTDGSAAGWQENEEKVDRLLQRQDEEIRQNEEELLDILGGVQGIADHLLKDVERRTDNIYNRELPMRKIAENLNQRLQYNIHHQEQKTQDMEQASDDMLNDLARSVETQKLAIGKLKEKMAIREENENRERDLRKQDNKKRVQDHTREHDDLIKEHTATRERERKERHRREEQRRSDKKEEQHQRKFRDYSDVGMTKVPSYTTPTYKTSSYETPTYKSMPEVSRKQPPRRQHPHASQSQRDRSSQQRSPPRRAEPRSAHRREPVSETRKERAVPRYFEVQYDFDKEALYSRVPLYCRDCGTKYDMALEFPLESIPTRLNANCPSCQSKYRVNMGKFWERADISALPEELRDWFMNEYYESLQTS